MRILKIIILIVTLVSVNSCSKADDEIGVSLSVEQYVTQLKSGKYDASDLPSFTKNDIEALLKYRNETQLIKNFPRNSISSLALQECKLGVYILWTIESIRVVAINKDILVGRFPSQNPILALKNTQELNVISDKEALSSAAKAYYDWWVNNKHKNFIDYKTVDPLLLTSYQWK